MLSGSYKSTDSIEANPVEIDKAVMFVRSWLNLFCSIKLEEKVRSGCKLINTDNNEKGVYLGYQVLASPTDLIRMALLLFWM